METQVMIEDRARRWSQQGMETEHEVSGVVKPEGGRRKQQSGEVERRGQSVGVSE